MRIQRDGVLASLAGRRGKAIRAVADFVAVREPRCGGGNRYLTRYERGQEFREGSASYVEKKALQIMRLTRYRTSLPKPAKPLCTSLR